jgi:hypothetical protein
MDNVYTYLRNLNPKLDFVGPIIMTVGEQDGCLNPFSNLIMCLSERVDVGYSFPRLHLCPIKTFVGRDPQVELTLQQGEVLSNSVWVRLCQVPLVHAQPLFLDSR